MRIQSASQIPIFGRKDDQWSWVLSSRTTIELTSLIFGRCDLCVSTSPDGKLLYSLLEILSDAFSVFVVFYLL